ncbi:hypothetical protein VTK73DRAFT_447 [Phialemonium thermophilum]|uniref:Methyltransferase domain-containing protein n=1 Tax=Phialemonium thermophilum TaxID=223376 RepID=A0ABR3XFE9_9PEZI
MTPPKEGGHETPDQSSLGILPAKHWMTQAAELDFQGGSQDDEDADSAFGGDTSSSTASISSSILKYRTLNGRTYHSERGNAQYWGSNDERANETMDINHHVLTLVLGGKLFLAPLEKDKIHKVLDVGTGTGIWAIDFADQFPNTEVVGTDVSPIQPTWVPPNLKFEIEDCTQDWTFAPNSIDYIHMRWLVGSIDDWTALMRRAYDALRPGGYIESFEASSCIVSDDGSVTDDSAMGQWGPDSAEGSGRSRLRRHSRDPQEDSTWRLA